MKCTTLKPQRTTNCIGLNLMTETVAEKRAVYIIDAPGARDARVWASSSSRRLKSCSPFYINHVVYYVCYARVTRSRRTRLAEVFPRESHHTARATRRRYCACEVRASGCEHRTERARVRESHGGRTHLFVDFSVGIGETVPRSRLKYMHTRLWG